MWVVDIVHSKTNTARVDELAARVRAYIQPRCSYVVNAGFRTSHQHVALPPREFAAAATVRFFVTQILPSRRIHVYRA